MNRRMGWRFSLIAGGLLALVACSSTAPGLPTGQITGDAGQDGEDGNGGNNGSNNDGIGNNGIGNNDGVLPDVGDDNNGQPADTDLGDALLPDTDPPDTQMGDAWMSDAPPDVEPDIPTGPIPNEGWIGGPCASPADCEHVESPLCLTGADYPGGQCTEACDRFCPDLDGENSVTFCIDVDGQGRCASRCDFDLYPGEGCRDGYACRIVGRYNEASTQNSTCVPTSWESVDANTACRQRLDELGIIWSPWDYTTQTAEGTNLACTVSDPIRVSSPINGVEYRYYNQDTPGTMAVTCNLALALHRLGDILRPRGVRAVLHIGTFNCRRISGSQSLSQHAHANAIDIWGLERDDGSRAILEQHWEHDTTNPQTANGRLLYEVAHAMYDQRVFNIILTPNYNAAHDNHFHVDLTDGSHYIGHGESGITSMDEGPDRCGIEVW